MDLKLQLVDEGFKLCKHEQGYCTDYPQLDALFTHANGRACFQMLISLEDKRFALSTGVHHWYSEKGHIDRFRVALSVSGDAQTDVLIEGMMLDDDGAWRADVLHSKDQQEYAAGDVAALFAQVRPKTAGDMTVTVRIYHALGTHPEQLVLTRELPMTVYPIKLPAPTDYAFYLDLWQHPSNLARKHETPLWSDAHFGVIDHYAASMAALGQKSITVLAGDIPWRGQGCIDNKRLPADLFEYAMVRTIRRANGQLAYDYSAMDRYIDIYEKHGVLGDIEILGLCNIWMKESFDDHPLVLGDPEPYISLPIFDECTGALSYINDTRQVDAFIAALAQHLRDTGRMARARLAADEPADIPAYRRSIERIRRVAPAFRLKTAINHAEFIAEFSDYIDDFMPSLQSVCEQYDTLQGIRAKLNDKRFLWYVCLHPHHPNTFLRSNLCETRLIGMLTRHMKMDGFLRWNYTVWPANPRDDIRYGGFAAGDTNFVYPANDGRPLLTLRYKALQRAIEDFELLHLMNEAGLGDKADEIAQSVLVERDVRKFFPDDAGIPLDQMCAVDYRAYERARKQMLEALSLAK